METPIRIVARPKLAGPGEHVGVQLQNGLVAHHGPEGVRIDPLTAFAQGHPVRVVRGALQHTYPAIMERLAYSLAQPLSYRASTNNCEHYAHWLIDGDAWSPQVATLTAIGVIGLVAWASESG